MPGFGFLRTSHTCHPQVFTIYTSADGARNTGSRLVSQTECFQFPTFLCQRSLESWSVWLDSVFRGPLELLSKKERNRRWRENVTLAERSLHFCSWCSHFTQHAWPKVNILWVNMREARWNATAHVLIRDLCFCWDAWYVKVLAEAISSQSSCDKDRLHCNSRHDVLSPEDFTSSEI